MPSASTLENDCRPHILRYEAVSDSSDGPLEKEAPLSLFACDRPQTRGPSNDTESTDSLPDPDYGDRLPMSTIMSVGHTVGFGSDTKLYYLSQVNTMSVVAHLNDQMRNIDEALQIVMETDQGLDEALYRFL
ncbi:hypothetical protein HDU91_001722 [Kappamyces sp. JEL0680]|nr:hypothetical protein HDU91_001722 [Kappamyces sp. JEL0680]